MRRHQSVDWLQPFGIIERQEASIPERRPQRSSAAVALIEAIGRMG
jgi:hypothetical protein